MRVIIAGSRTVTEHHPPLPRQGNAPMTNFSPIDELALPAELARQRRLDPADWLLREVVLECGSPHLHDLPVAPRLRAVLLPRNAQAIRQFDTIWGQCFLAVGYLWFIGSGELQIDACGLGTVQIECHALWQQPSESRRVEVPPATCFNPTEE